MSNLLLPPHPPRSSSGTELMSGHGREVQGGDRDQTPDGATVDASEARILVVDDEPVNTSLLSHLLARWGYRDVHVTNRSADVIGLCAEVQPDLLILDLHMPSPDGFQVMRLLRPLTGGTVRLPILVITVDVSPQTRRRVLSAGAQDFLGKPFDLEEVRLRVLNLLQTRRLQEDLRRHGGLLEARVRERTREVRDARIEIVQRLAAAAEHRDDETGQHTRRVARTARLLAIELGLPTSMVELIAVAAPLHDVGKIAIPDAILLKAGRLTHDEFEVMKTHVVRGADILSGSTSPLLQIATDIALGHHERWDGCGYIHGWSGEDIPLTGRIVCVADVFDALTHERPYKKAWPVERAVQEILGGAGTQFDPQVVDAFAQLDHAGLLAPVLQPYGLPGRVGPADELGPAEPLGARDDDDDQPLTGSDRQDLVVVADADQAGPPTVTLGEAATALEVSPSTLRRWADDGRIRAVRTSGGHRRFPVQEVRRLRSSNLFVEAPAVRLLAPPVGPLTSAASLLAERGQQIGAAAARSVYSDGPGWWTSETAQAQIEAWLQRITAGLVTGEYAAALTATQRLDQQAQLAGTSQLERSVFVERFCEIALRRLLPDDRLEHSELAGLRRLFICLRHSLLDTESSAAPAGGPPSAAEVPSHSGGSASTAPRTRAGSGTRRGPRSRRVAG